MIDAYEIGIQLMLQEDVSAGLAVINRGLADVDQAIAVTSADLAGLVREAESATKAVAVAASGRAALGSVAEQTSNGSGEQVAPAQSRREPVTTPAANSAEEVVAPEMKPSGPVAPARPTISPTSDGQSGPEQNRLEQIVPSSAPIKDAVGERVGGVVNETAIISQRETSKQAELSPVVTAPPAQVAPSAPISAGSVPQPAQGIPAAVEEPRRSVTPQAAQVAITASVGHKQQPPTAPAQPEQVPQRLSPGPAGRRERAAAPGSGVAYSGQQDATTRLQDKAAAPQSPSRNQDEAGGGTVMLDGRLVGQFLAEHMAREASRPPVGTSFFDPRQTPAWYVSGAL